MANSKYWIYALTSIFGLGVLYIGVIEFALIGTVLPKLVDVVNGTTNTPISIDAGTQATILSNYDTIVFFLRTMPFALLLIIVIYMLVVSFRKESEEQIVR